MFDKSSRSRKKKKKYDLPLASDGGSRFLLLVIAIMVFLATLTLNTGVKLSGVTSALSKGVHDKATVEIIPDVQNTDFDIEKEAGKVLNYLRSNPDIKQAALLSLEDVQAMLSPWIGEGISEDVIPLPRVISIEFLNRDKAVKTLEQRLPEISPYARIDTHDNWAGSILSLSNALRAASFSIILVTVIALVTIVGSGIHARIQIYKDEVELLHLIGARDIYVAKQFQRHAFSISLKATVFGFLSGNIFYYLCFTIVGAIMNFESSSFFSLAYLLFSFFGFVLFVVLLSMMTARITVLRSLARLP